MKANFIVPAINIGGGLREVINLAEKMQKMDVHAEITALWRGMHQMPTRLPVKEITRISASRLWASFTFLYVFLCLTMFLMKSRKNLLRNEFFVFTHYVTIPFSFLVKRKQRLFFVQGLEWRFLGSGVWSRLLKTVLIFCYRRGVVITANSYLTQELRDLGVPVQYSLSIWADPEFKGESTADEQRDFDFVMVLRRGAPKRLDLYLQFIALCSKNSGIKIAVITPDDELASLTRNSVAQVLVRPSMHEMRAVYTRSKVFVMLSEHEGFGLPPLEAMGCACVPVCRASGGVRAYMYGDFLNELVLPLNMPLDALFQFCTQLIADHLRLRSCSIAAVERFDEGVEKAKTRNVVIQKLISDMQNVLSSANLKH
jgi:glycosyltransferase involved in cell wall biosynthesis